MALIITAVAVAGVPVKTILLVPAAVFVSAVTVVIIIALTVIIMVMVLTVANVRPAVGLTVILKLPVMAGVAGKVLVVAAATAASAAFTTAWYAYAPNFLTAPFFLYVKCFSIPFTRTGFIKQFG